MEKTSISFLLLYFLYLLVFLVYTESSSSLVPALYIFGGSEVDCGFNNKLNTTIKAYYQPYGSDFPIGHTGRFTNGRTIADFLDDCFGLSTANYYSTSEKKSDEIVTTGLNFASGSAGILPETGRASGENWSLEEQVAMFNMTLEENLVTQLKQGTANFTQYLAQSIFMVFIGSSDYTHNYLQPHQYNSSKEYTPAEFASILVAKLGTQLENLYKLGARRLLVFQIGPIGCYPAIRKSFKPETKCADYINNMVAIFNTKLDAKVRELRSMYKDATFVIANTFKIILEIVKDPLSYGFNETSKPCCGIRKDGTGLCMQEQEPCDNREETLFWDDYNLGEFANILVTEACFMGRTMNMPTSIYEGFDLEPSGQSAIRSRLSLLAAITAGFHLFFIFLEKNLYF